MLGNIFSDKISCHNANYKDWVHRAFIEEGLDAPQPYEDVSEYIEYINQNFKSLQVGYLFSLIFKNKCLINVNVSYFKSQNQKLFYWGVNSNCCSLYFDNWVKFQLKFFLINFERCTFKKVVLGFVYRVKRRSFLET